MAEKEQDKNGKRLPPWPECDVCLAIAVPFMSIGKMYMSMNMCSTDQVVLLMTTTACLHAFSNVLLSKTVMHRPVVVSNSGCGVRKSRF